MRRLRHVAWRLAVLGATAVAVMSAVLAAVYLPRPQTPEQWIDSHTTVPATVNLNTATTEDLLLLNGMTPSLAEDIVAYRVTIGCFLKPEDVLGVTGITEELFSAWQTQLTV